MVSSAPGNLKALVVKRLLPAVPGRLSGIHGKGHTLRFHHIADIVKQMEFKFRPDQHPIRNPLFLHVLNGSQAYISGILVKRAVFLTNDTCVPAHGQGRDLCKWIHHRGIRVRYEHHITLFHRSISIIGSVKPNSLCKDLLVKPFHRNRDVPPPSI